MRPFSLLAVLLLSGLLSAAHAGEKFDIVFLADLKYAADPAWVSKMQTTWHATGINLRIKWTDVQKPDLSYDWTGLDAALDNLAAYKMKIFVRVSFTWTLKAWFRAASPGSYHHAWDGSAYLRPWVEDPALHDRRMFNFTDLKGRAKMVDAFGRIVQHLAAWPRHNMIELIVPTTSQDDESEYPFFRFASARQPNIVEMSGYSDPEKKAFVAFLKRRYKSVARMNTVWGSSFTAFTPANMDISKFGWQTVSTTSLYPAGRKDWIDFKTGDLRSFYGALAAKAKGRGFPFGIQFGSLYDNLILYRGFYDPTVLLDNVDYLILGDVASYEPGFEFAANYARSLSSYWTWRRKRSSPVRFATETNWPEYSGLSADTLISRWKDQLNAYYEQGASALFVSHWGTTDLGEPNQIPQRVKSDYYLRVGYDKWAAFLGEPRETRHVTANRALHLSCEQALYWRQGESGMDDFRFNSGDRVTPNDSTRLVFPLPKMALSAGTPGNSKNAVGPADIVTNYMIAHAPAYLKRYGKGGLLLNKTSYFIPDDVYSILLGKQLKSVPLYFGTRAESSAKTAAMPDLGKKNERNRTRSSNRMNQRVQPEK